MSMLGDMFFFLGSRLGDSLFVQFTCGSNAEVRLQTNVLGVCWCALFKFPSPSILLIKPHLRRHLGLLYSKGILKQMLQCPRQRDCIAWHMKIHKKVLAWKNYLYTILLQQIQIYWFVLLEVLNEKMAASFSQRSCNDLFSSTYLQQKNFNFLVRDSFINIGPVRDFAHGLRMNADPNASGAAKQSNYELVWY